MNDEYSDIIGLPHHVSKRHPPMAMEKRAAQFAPFAALTGHREALEDTTLKHIDGVSDGITPLDEDMIPEDFVE